MAGAAEPPPAVGKAPAHQLQELSASWVQPNSGNLAAARQARQQAGNQRAATPPHPAHLLLAGLHLLAGGVGPLDLRRPLLLHKVIKDAIL